MTDICCDVICEQQGCLHTRLATELAELRTECAALHAALSAAEKRADEAYERAAKACEEVAAHDYRMAEQMRTGNIKMERVAMGNRCDYCAAAIRALSPLTALPQTAKHETTGNED